MPFVVMVTNQIFTNKLQNLRQRPLLEHVRDLLCSSLLLLFLAALSLSPAALWLSLFALLISVSERHD